MSVATQPRTAAEQTRKAPVRLSLIATRPSSLARTPFLVILALVLVAGMVGLVMLQTLVQQQSFELRQLQAQATALEYQQAQLEAEIRARSTPAELARQATDLGMVPNPNPAFVDLGTGKVTGVTTPVRGDEVPSLTYRSQAQAPSVRRKAVVPTAEAPPQPESATPSGETAAQSGDSVTQPGAGG